MDAQVNRSLLSQPLFWIGVCGLLALCAAVFGGALNFALLSFDDDINISLNPHMGAMSLDRMAWASSDWVYLRRYVPFAWSTYFAIYTFSGLSPLGYHLASLILHAANAVLVFWVIARVIIPSQPLTSRNQSFVAAWLGAAWWAVHPQKAELVCWASGIFNLQSGLFLLVSLAAALEASQGKCTPARRRWSALSLGAYALSLFSYPTGLGFAVVLVILDASRSEQALNSPRAWARLFWERRAWLILSLIAGAIATVAQLKARGVWTSAQKVDVGLAYRFTQASEALGRSIWKLSWPFHLSPIYDTFVDFKPAAFEISAAAVFVGMVIACWGYLARTGHWGLLWLSAAYVAVIVPSLGWTEYPYSPSDRYSYIPSIAVAVGLSWLISKFGGRICWLASAVIATLAISSYVQTGVWRDDLHLLTHVEAQLTKSNARAEVILRIGKNYFDRGDFALAERYARKGMALMELPAHAEPLYGTSAGRSYADGAPLAWQHNALGSLHAAAHEWAEAEDHFRLALRISPAFFPANLNLALILSAQGKTQEPLHLYLRAERQIRGGAESVSSAVLLRRLARTFRNEGRAATASALDTRATALEADQGRPK